MITLMIIVAMVIAVYYSYKKSRKDLYELAAKLQGPDPVPLIGNVLIFAGPQKKIFRKFIDVDVLYKSPTRYWLGPQLHVSIDKPEHVQAILSTQTTIKGDAYKMISDCIGFGLIQSEGLKHKTHRKIMSLPLRDQVLEKYINIFDSKGKECAINIEKYVDKGYFNVVEEVEKTTMAVVCETILGVKMESNNSQNEHLVKIISGLYKSISERMYKIWIHPYVTFRFSEHYKIQKEGMEFFNKFLDNVIDERKKAIEISNESNPDDISLDRLLQIKDENNKNIFSYDEIKEELMTLFTASEDTTMTVTSFVLLMLGMHKDVQQKVWEEQVQILGSGGSPDLQIEAHHVKDMKYLQMVIEETLRLFPIAPLIIRKVIKDVDIGEITLKKDVNLIINIYSMHRDETIWSEPDKFNPMRFTSEEKAKRHPYSYIPFSAGFRGCIGKPFAFVTIKCILSHIVRRYTIFNHWKMEDIILESDISVRSTNGYQIQIKARESKVDTISPPVTRASRSIP